MSKYLDAFDKILYDGVVMSNLTTRLDFIDSLISEPGVMFKYELKTDEKPEDLAFNLYGDATYHWIILQANNIRDPFYDWFLTDAEVLARATAKYDDVNTTHHWLLDGANFREQPADIASVIVTNLEYEQDLNNEKRHVNIIYPEYIRSIVSEFESVLEA